MLRYCRCGYPIWVEERFEGFAWVQVLRDYEKGQEVILGMMCGQALERDEDLVNEPPE